MTFYEVLGVSETATSGEIKAAFRARAKETHPDQNPGSNAADARFREVCAAFEVIGDAARRGDYDRELARQRREAAALAKRAEEARRRDATKRTTAASSPATTLAAKRQVAAKAAKVGAAVAGGLLGVMLGGVIGEAVIGRPSDAGEGLTAGQRG